MLRKGNPIIGRITDVQVVLWSLGSDALASARSRFGSGVLFDATKQASGRRISIAGEKYPGRGWLV